MFLWRNKKNIYLIPSLILTYVCAIKEFQLGAAVVYSKILSIRILRVTTVYANSLDPAHSEQPRTLYANQDLRCRREEIWTLSNVLARNEDTDQTAEM